MFNWSSAKHIESTPYVINNLRYGREIVLNCWRQYLDISFQYTRDAPACRSSDRGVLVEGRSRQGNVGLIFS